MAISSGLNLFDLIFFALTIIPVLYIFFRHGRHGILGWYFLSAFCLLRVVGAALLRSSNPSTLRTGGIVTQVALSPLFFTFFGLFHEASVSIRHYSPFWLGWGSQIFMHLAIGGTLAITLVGAVNLDTSGSTSDKTDIDLVRAGSVIFLGIWMMLAFLLWKSWTTQSKVRGERLLIKGLICCMPLLFVRVLYSVLGSFINSASWGFLSGGTLAEQVVLKVIPECSITLAIIVVGIMSINISAEREQVVRGGLPISNA